MSIYINGIDIPQDGMVRSISIEADGSVRFFGGSSVIAKAVEVPPHGRCIDADAFAAKYIADMPDAIHELKDKRKVQMLVNQIQALLMDIAEADTIIPADGKESKG